jgi:hypothetical protein
LIVHANDVRPHMPKIFMTFPDENDAAKAPHPLYSSDLPPSGFFLFGHVKQLLRGAEFPDRDSLFDANVQISTGLEKITVNDVVPSWIDRLRSWAAAHGGHIG